MSNPTADAQNGKQVSLQPCEAANPQGAVDERQATLIREVEDYLIVTREEGFPADAEYIYFIFEPYLTSSRTAQGDSGLSEAGLEAIASEHDMNVPDALLASPDGFGVHMPSLRIALAKHLRTLPAAQGDDAELLPAWLLPSAQALLDLDAENALVPHGIGGHARDIIQTFIEATTKEHAERQQVIAEVVELLRLAKDYVIELSSCDEDAALLNRIDTALASIQKTGKDTPHD